MALFSSVSIARRLAALVYEFLLVGAVTAIAGLAAGIMAIVLNPISIFLSSFVTCVLVLGAWWFYFKVNWHKKGQTLPMQVWKIGLCNQQGVKPSLHQLRIRFIWACVFIVFIPLLAYGLMRHLVGIPAQPAFAVALIWWILPWGFALLNPDRQFLYDFLAGTRLVDLKVKDISGHQ